MIKLDWLSVEACIEDTGEQYALERWVEERHAKMGRDLNILEIGSYCGRSTAILAQFGHVIAIDLWGDPYDGLKHYDTVGAGTFEKFRSNMVRLNLLGTRVFPIIATSKVLHFFPPECFDVIFIDANHAYDAVKQDIQHSKSHLMPTGLYVFDDYKRPPIGGVWDPEEIRSHGGNPWEGVADAVDELLGEGEFKITDAARGRVKVERKR